MLYIGKNYIMKNGNEVYLLRMYQDFFSEEEFVVIKQDEQVFIARRFEFEAHITDESKRVKRSNQEKIHLYRSYFRGRDTMVATSFTNSEGKRVYYPWCLSRKKYPCPKVKKSTFPCVNCTVQKFQSITDKIIWNHLRGVDQEGREAFYGMYPLMEDNRVYVLAIDFDKKDWRQSVKAMVNSAEYFEVSPLLEISQSGNGCHMWFFFEEVIEAKIARNFGNALLKYSMLENPELSFESYDRMFPNQNELSVGGFGNLIALPLQGSRVKQGCSRFIDKQFNLIEDVWGALEKTPKLSMSVLKKVTAIIEKKLPVKYYESSTSDVGEELCLFKLSEQENIVFERPLRIVVTSHLNIQKAALTREEIVQLKFLATFHNKAFYTAQRKRLSTKDIPRVISLVEIDKETIRLPRGLKDKVKQVFPNVEFSYECEEGKIIDVQFVGDLYPKQQQALHALEEKDMGILCAGTGFGKTIVAAKLIADQKVSTLILVHNTNLAGQWKSQLEHFLKINDEPFVELTEKGRKRRKSKVGRIYGGKESRSGLIDIGLFQTVTRYEDLQDLLRDYGMIIVDEAHHVAAKTFEDVMKQVASKYVYGLTATPQREDGLENIIFMRLGEISYTAEKEIPKHIEQKLFIRFTSLGEQVATINNQTIHENYEMMIESKDRNQQIISDILSNLKDNRHIIVLSRYIKHIDLLKDELEQRNVTAPIYILNSKMQNRQLREELANLKQEGQPFVLLTTGSYAGEGFDLPALDTLLLVMPISSKGNLQQYLGRLLRNLDEKEDLRVYDYIDYAIPMIYRMYQKRLRTYKKLGYHLFEDEHTELCKSNLFSEGYEPILQKDLANAQQKILLIMPYLSKSIIEFLNAVHFVRGIERTLFLPEAMMVTSKSRQYVDQLMSIGYRIIFKCNIHQTFVVIDGNLVWMVPNQARQKGNELALRMYSSEIVKRLQERFE